MAATAQALFLAVIDPGTATVIAAILGGCGLIAARLAPRTRTEAARDRAAARLDDAQAWSELLEAAREDAKAARADARAARELGEDLADALGEERRECDRQIQLLRDRVVELEQHPRRPNP